MESLFSGAIGAIIGAAIGGFITWKGTHQLEENRLKEREKKAAFFLFSILCRSLAYSEAIEGSLKRHIGDTDESDENIIKGVVDQLRKRGLSREEQKRVEIAQIVLKEKMINPFDKVDPMDIPRDILIHMGEYNEVFWQMGTAFDKLFEELEKKRLTVETLSTVVEIYKVYVSREEAVLKKCQKTAGITKAEFEESYLRHRDAGAKEIPELKSKL